MFTGIIEALGSITSTEPDHKGLRLQVDLSGLRVSDISIGDSIAVNGTCLTVTQLNGNTGCFDVSPETLDKCLIGQWRVGESVNLETALTLNKPLGGHLVSGHVDGTGELIERRDSEESTWMRLRTEREIGRYIAVKGSITVDGISLTSNQVFDEGETTFFDLTLVPHTLAVTSLGAMKKGTSVHLEIDLMARYIDRMQHSDQKQN
ncbi:MAG: riboflavin synthase [Acidiferrobacterales bacterium]|nr:riboflavin synthase [Acidiferrobacterales bacterium]